MTTIPRIVRFHIFFAAALLLAGCPLALNSDPPFAFTGAALAKMPAADGATELVFSYGLENRSNAPVTAARIRADLYRHPEEPELLVSLDSETDVRIAPGQRSDVEIVLNPTLYYDPGPDIFVEGLRVVELSYEGGDNWRNRLGRYVYPHRIPLSAAGDRES